MTPSLDDRLPVLVGVTGRRMFDEDPARNAAILGEFRQRFTDLAGRLDSVLLPDTPKVLLCGGAAGTDLAAARVALERPAWSVVLMLPLDEALFEQDFAAAPFDADLPYLRELRAQHDRVIVKRMRALHEQPYDDGRLEPIGAARVSPERLAYDRAARAEHFEQLGLWLARYTTLLVAAAPAEVAPLKLGGTARIVAYRRSATPDARADAVIQRSSELLSSSPFEDPDGGYVLWIDPTRPAPMTGGPLPGVTLLPPIQRVFDVRKDERLGTDVRDALYRAPMQADPFAPAADFAGRHNEFCRGALALALAFQRRHARQRRAARPCPPALTGPEHPAVFLNGMRKGGELERQQSRASEHTRQAQRWAAFLFVLSLASYETYAELLPDRGWPLVSYIALLLGIWLIAAVACRRKIQTIAEDYRGLREMMRVQVAWWSAGINRMVDRIHLRTIDTDVRLVREAAAAISMWSVLRCSWLQTCDVTAAPPPDAPESARPAPLYRDWITEQAAYFFTQSHAQAGAKRLAEAAFEVTFATALAAFGVLFVVGHALKGRFSPHLATLAMPALLAWPLLAALTAGGLLWAITGNWRGGTAERKRAWLAWALSVPVLLLAAEALRRALGWGDLPEWATWTLDWLGPALFVVLLGLLVFQRIPDGARAFNVPKFADSQKLPGALLLFALLLSGAVAFAPNFARLHAANDPDGFGEAFRALILTQAVLALGSSGMVRWYTERRNHLAQAAAYDDMLRMFRRAQAWLHERGDQPLDRPAQQALVALGELALDENAAWLKAHRERPIEAIAGT